MEPFANSNLFSITNKHLQGCTFGATHTARCPRLMSRSVQKLTGKAGKSRQDLTALCGLNAGGRGEGCWLSVATTASSCVQSQLRVEWTGLLRRWLALSTSTR